MIIDNLTGFDLNFSITQPTELNFLAVVRDVCTQVDGIIALGLLFILLYWVLVHILQPISTQGIKDSFPKLAEIINPMIDKGLSMLETLMLGFAVYINVLYFTQNGYANIRFSFVLFFGGLVIISSLIRLKTLLDARKRGKHDD